MLNIKLDMEIPETCYDCPLQVEPCGCCIIDIPEQRSTYPYCNPRNHWNPDDYINYNRFINKPDWCPLEKENVNEDH